MTERLPTIVNLHTALEIAAEVPVAWTHLRRELTPAMKDAGPGRFGIGRLGVNVRRVPAGHSACPADTGIAHQTANPATPDNTGDVLTRGLDAPA